MNFENKVIVVTGGGGGIGRELVLALLARNAKVAAVDLRAEGLDKTATLAEGSDRLSLHVLDVTDRDGVEALPAKVIGKNTDRRIRKALGFCGDAGVGRDQKSELFVAIFTTGSGSSSLRSAVSVTK